MNNWHLLFEFSLLCFALLTSVVAQTIQPQGTTASVHIEYEIDGEKDPESIQDLVAYRHFFAVLAKSATVPAAAEEVRRHSYLRHFLRPGCGVQRSDDRTLTDSQMARLLRVADELAVKFPSVGLPTENSGNCS